MLFSEQNPPKCYWLLEDLGQMGNKLVLFSHLAALCMSEGGKVYFPAFARHAKHFKNFSDQDIPHYEKSIFFPQMERRGQNKIWGMYLNMLFRVLRKLKVQRLRVAGVSYLWIETGGVTIKSDYDLSDLSDQSPPNSKKIFGLFGWRFRHQRQLEDLEDSIVELFALNNSLTANAKSRINKIRSQMSEPAQVLGLHIRGGDYRSEFQGARYVSAEQAIEIAARYAEKSIKQYHIIIFSNEKIEIPAGYSDLMSSGPGTQMEDFATMSYCDEIIAPMSTFSGFASFLGGVPLAEITAQTRGVVENDFSVVRYFGPRPNDY